MKSFVLLKRGNLWATTSPLMVMLAGAGRWFAQAVANAQISGVVTDASGALVPEAKVTATQTNTGLTRTTVTSSAGTYALPNLPIGPYRLEVAAGGFATYVQTGILLQVSNNVEVNVTLQVGQVTQEVKVSADASMVQTQSTSISQVIDQTRMLELPLNGRLATQLVLLSGASYNTQSSALVSSKNFQTSVTISVAGGQVDGTNYLMDGGDNNNAFTNVNMPFPFPDAIQEFSVQTSGLSARYGEHPGGVVNVVTKSGTDEIHGDLLEFVRNGDFNARDFFAAKHDALKRNQFGGTVGGPLSKDKPCFWSSTLYPVFNGVTHEGDALHWNCRLPPGAWESRYSLATAAGSAELGIRSIGGAPVSDLTLAGKNLLTVGGSVRVITQASGTPLSLLGTEPVETQVTVTGPSGPLRRQAILPDQVVRLSAP